ncbi:MAG: hypothetical protein ACYDC9_13340, partial [Dermatophilaceae bacterium]
MSTAGPRVVSHESGTYRRPAARVALAVCVIALVQLLLVLLFAGSSSRSAPHDLPIAVAGPTSAAQALAQGLEHA